MTIVGKCNGGNKVKEDGKTYRESMEEIAPFTKSKLKTSWYSTAGAWVRTDMECKF